MGGFQFRDATVRVLALARSLPCACADLRGRDGCLPCQARELATYLPSANVVAIIPPRPRPAPALFAHTAAAARDLGRGRRSQSCADCGALLELGGRGATFYPAGTRLYAMPGLLTIGGDLPFRMLGRNALDCLSTELSVTNVAHLGLAPMRFVALLRVSTRGQARDGFGLDAQEEAVRAWARTHKHRITYVIHEAGVPGTTPLVNRDGLAEALQLISAGKVDGLVVPRLDRLARDLILQEQLIAEVDALGAVLRSAAASEDDHLLDADPQRVLVRQILGAVSQYERAMIRMRLSNGLRLKAAAGGYTGGRPPYGWVARGRQLVPVAAEQEVRRRMKEWVRQGWSYRKIAERLNSEGIPTKDGSIWSSNTVRRIVISNRRAIPQGPPPQAPPTTERKAG